MKIIGKTVSIFIFWTLGMIALLCQSALSVEPVKISSQDTALDLSRAVEIHHIKGNTFQTSTAAGPDGIVRRIEMQGNGDTQKVTGRFLP